MDKQTAVHLDSGTLEWWKETNYQAMKKTRWKPRCILPSERSQSEKTTIVYDSNYMSFWKRQNYGESEKMRGCQGLKKRDNEVEHQASWGQWNTLCDTVMMETHHHTFVQTHRTHNTAVSPDINCGPGEVMTCQGRLTSCNKCLIWWGLWMMREAVCAGGRGVGKIARFSS